MFNKKRKKDMNAIFKEIAKQEGITVAQVKAEMQYAIDETMKNNDPEQQLLFKYLFGDKRPTPEEFIEAVGNEAEKNLIKMPMN